MVALNDYLPLNHIQLQKNLCKEINIFMKSEFDHFLEKEKELIKKNPKKN